MAVSGSILQSLPLLLVLFLSTSVDQIESGQKTKHILLYTSLAAPLPNWHLGKSNVGDYKYFQQIKCPWTDCVVTSNRSYLPSISDFDAIGLNSWDIKSMATFPPPETRHPDQIYFVYYHESPSRTKGSLSNYSTLFNWTMSYVLHADVVVPYSYILDTNTGEVVAPALKPKWKVPNYLTATSLRNPSVLSLVRGKSKMAAWFVSSCYSPSQRKFVVRKLQEYLPVDVYGKCGSLSCGKKEKGACREMVERDYYFYLSFENSLCEDYVTEKVFEMMTYYVIPVVFGGADYLRFLPPRSYINVLDFESIQDLAAYLHYVANNVDEYLKYFWWKDHYAPAPALNFCPLCEKMTKMAERPAQKQYYANLDHWFKNGTCLDHTQIPLIRQPLIQYYRIKLPKTPKPPKGKKRI